jgi:type VI secretion system protein ImpC
MVQTQRQTTAESQVDVADSAASLLEQAISATKQTAPDRAQELLQTLTEEALSGTVTFNKNLTKTITEAIARIDERMSVQLAAIMHHEEFLKLEGSWRGLQYLVKNSETGTDLKIRVFNVSKKALAKDLDKAAEFDQSILYKHVYESEFGVAGGAPYGLLIGDYEFSHQSEDIELLRNISQVAAAAFAPFVASAGSAMFGFDDFRDLNKQRDLAKIFDTVEYAKWQSFRASDDARFVTLTLPRTLARGPYGSSGTAIEEFNYEEAPRERTADGRVIGRVQEHKDYCWMSAAYVLGARITNAFSEYGWCTAIRGAEGGGKVENLPSHTFTTDDGDVDQKCPTEIGITDRREAELSKCGFLPLCHYKNTDYSVFFGAQTTQKPQKYDRPEATANAAISSRLPYLLATSRFAHFLKVMARDWVGSFMEASDCENKLDRWIKNYVNANEGASADTKARYPLREARVEVKEIPGQPGCYNAVAYLRPWLQMEELTTSLRMVARIPSKG